jgi:hypothetical protein
MSISDKKMNDYGAHVEHRENVSVNCGEGGKPVTEGSSKYPGSRRGADKHHAEGTHCRG